MLACLGEGRWSSRKGVAGWSDALRESRAHWATAPGPRGAEVPGYRTRASRSKVAPFAHQATLPNEDYHTEKSVLFPQIDRLDGFRAKRADAAFRPKTRGNISRLQRRENGNHTPHSKPITHAHAHAGQQSSLRRKCISLADRASGPSAAAHSRRARLTPPPRPPASPSPSHPAPAATARDTGR